MKSFKKWIVFFSLMVAFLWAGLNTASAAIVNVEGSKFGEEASALVDFGYTALSKRQGELRLTISNTSRSDFAIKALYLDLPEEIGAARLYRGKGWKSMFQSDPTFYAGLFDLLMFSNLKAIKQGENTELTVRLKGKNLQGLDENDFLDLLQNDGLALYFKGKDNFNRYRIDVATTVASPMSTPIPSAIFLLGPALAMIGVLRAKVRHF